MNLMNIVISHGKMEDFQVNLKVEIGSKMIVNILISIDIGILLCIIMEDLRKEEDIQLWICSVKLVDYLLLLPLF